jgi:uncharacterized protein (UPF0332 family)
MIFAPEAWLQVADVCCGDIPEVSREALLRTAVNRAYYAALLELKRRIEAAQRPGAVPGWGTHGALKHALRTAGASFKEIEGALSRLRQARETADYVLTSPELDLSHVQKLVGTARWLIRNRIKAKSDAEFRRLHVPR